MISTLLLIVNIEIRAKHEKSGYKTKRQNGERMDFVTLLFLIFVLGIRSFNTYTRKRPPWSFGTCGHTPPETKTNALSSHGLISSLELTTFCVLVIRGLSLSSINTSFLRCFGKHTRIIISLDSGWK